MQNLGNPRHATTDAPALHRIGAVAKLAGVPVPTLRVWESRYGAFAPTKSTGLHRLYTEADVLKARVLRQLTASGHSIGRIAHLALPQLQAMQASAQAATGGRAASPRIEAAVVGDGVAVRVAARDWQLRHFDGAFDVRRVFADLDAVLAAAPEPMSHGATAILIARLNTLHAATHQKLLAAIERLGVERVIVLYNYGPQVLVEALRTAGVQVRREPVADADLADLVRSVALVDAAGSLEGFRAGALIPRRRYSESTLASVAASPNSVVCECPRHIAELIVQLASFEAYSEQCLQDTQEDARLHAYLRSVAGSARALFEHALHLAARHGGLDLPEDADPAAA